MKRKCPKCGNNDMRVWALVNWNGMFLQCKSCNWKSKDMPWTKKAKDEMGKFKENPICPECGSKNVVWK